MEVEGGVFDIVGRPAVVVDDRHLVAGSSSCCASTCSGRLVSTTTSRAPAVRLQHGLLPRR